MVSQKPVGKGKSVMQFYTNISAETDEKIRILCNKLHISKRELIRQAINDYWDSSTIQEVMKIEDEIVRDKELEAD